MLECFVDVSLNFAAIRDFVGGAPGAARCSAARAICTYPVGSPETRGRTLVAVVQQVAATVQIFAVLHGCVARYLLHPACVRMARDAA